MATASFKEDLYIEDENKITEIFDKLKKNGSGNKIIAEQPPELPENARLIWFNRSKV